VVTVNACADDRSAGPDGVRIAPALLNALAGDDVAVDLAPADEEGRLRFAVAAVHPVPLRRMLPALQGMDLEVLHEHTVTHRRADGTDCHIYDLVLAAGPDAARGLAADWDGTAARITDTFHAIWAGRIEPDFFNVLIPAAGLTWRQAAVLRGYARYLRQLALPYRLHRVQQVLVEHPEATRAAVELFEARFADPRTPADDPRRRAAVDAAQQRLADAIDRVVHIDADRILRAYRSLIGNTVRTNAFAPEVYTADAPYLVFKFDAGAIDELPQPRPLSEIFVYAPEFEGLHLRFGLVARGGLRWSDRHDDYRTEVLGLVKAQAVKNSMIVPAGAKGVFVVNPAPGGDGGADRARGLRCYRQFVSALLDVVDNAPTGRQRGRTADIVCHDGPDPYLVVAADKGTATFSDVANDVALRRGYWLGDAFASGGSSGYDHKAMGITARGAWVSGDFHLAALGIDAHHDEFRVVGIGDMSGDVFGNGMLARPGIALIAAFDHRHIFVDPNPDVAAARAERRRLFELPGSSWDDYDRSLISAGGGVWPRTAKAVPVSPQMRAALGIPESVQHLAPSELIRHILCAPVDVLFNGGIGTYIKASDESHGEVGDKVNDAVRVDADRVRARVIVEGGNLGVTQRGRIEFARRGGYVNTDAIDNAAGVDCSDHEVNIKIMIDVAAQRRPLSATDRSRLLAEMTDDVAEHVLANNRAHNRALREAEHDAAIMTDVHARMIADLEARRGLHRELEHLPTAAEFTELARTGRGLTRPQLATLMAHTKLDLKARLLAEEDFDDPYFDAALRRYFPARLRREFGDDFGRHPLRREIIATAVVNHLVATSGLTYVFRLQEETGAGVGEIVRAHAVVSSVFALDELWRGLYDARLRPDTTNALVLEARRLLDRGSRWFLYNRPQPLRIEDEVVRFAGQVAALRGKLSAMLRGAELAAVNTLHAGYVEQGVPSGVARAVADSLYAYSLLDILETAYLHGEDATTLAHIYFEVSEYLGVDRLLHAVSALPRHSRWQRLARLALREDLYRSLRELVLDVSRRVYPHSDDVDVIEEFEAYNGTRLERVRRVLADFDALTDPDHAAVSVATAQLRRLTTTAT